MNLQKQKLTLEDVGKLAGVSRATVSRVINNYPHITAEVREQVLKVIRETGYQPNRIARSLASRKTGMIGLVIPHIAGVIMTNPYFLYLINSITSATNQQDLTLTLFLFHSEDEEGRIAKTIFNNNYLDGVIVTADRREDSFVKQLIAHDVPVVFIGKPEPDVPVSYVNVDNEHGAYLATEHLIQRGCQRVAAIVALYNTAGDDRHAGYQRALKAHGISYNERLVVEGDFSQESGYMAMQRLLQEAPDGVFVSSDLMAFGAQRAIREAGLSVPQDIAMVGFDDLPQAAVADPPLTTIRQPIHQLGPVALELLEAAIEQRAGRVESCVLPVELVLRST
ncbi:MAG TPA: LacI family DNA-binding transcriptional regulator [Aggregatilineales bacterium]|jgi:LacI family transcriptional regulator|nr:LacI family DNA-binding transcriptional regulator [Aggregatilineales bacterium]